LSGNWPAFERHLIQEGVNIEELKRRNETTKGKQYGKSWFLTQIQSYKTILEMEENGKDKETHQAR
jgi:hypothetical protein